MKGFGKKLGKINKIYIEDLKIWILNSVGSI